MSGELVTCLSAPCPADARRFHGGEEPSSRGATAMWPVVAPLVNSSAHSPVRGSQNVLAPLVAGAWLRVQLSWMMGRCVFARFESAIRTVGEEP